MENKARNIIASILFLIFIIALIIGGYIYVKDLSAKPDNPKTKEEDKKVKDYRIDKNKDYIYFENEEIISIDPELTYKDVYLNIEGAEIINSALKAEMDVLRNSIIKLDETNKDETKTLLYEETEVFNAKERNYIIYKSGNYYSLIINDLDFNCYSDFLTTGLQGYIINTKSGSIVTNEEIIKIYNLTLEDIKERVRLKLKESQNENDGDLIINIENTLNTLFDNYALYIDGNDLYITFIVKSNFVNYNDNVKLN